LVERACSTDAEPSPTRKRLLKGRGKKKCGGDDEPYAEKGVRIHAAPPSKMLLKGEAKKEEQNFSDANKRGKNV